MTHAPLKKKRRIHMLQCSVRSNRQGKFARTLHTERNYRKHGWVRSRGVNSLRAVEHREPCLVWAQNRDTCARPHNVIY